MMMVVPSKTVIIVTFCENMTSLYHNLIIIIKMIKLA